MLRRGSLGPAQTLPPKVMKLMLNFSLISIINNIDPLLLHVSAGSRMALNS